MVRPPMKKVIREKIENGQGKQPSGRTKREVPFTEETRQPPVIKGAEGPKKKTGRRTYVN